MTMEDIHSTEASPLESPPRFLSLTGLFAGPLLAVGVYFLLLWQAPDLGHAPRATAAIALLMGVWWMTEAIPLEATSLLPLVLLPLLGAVKNFQAAATPFADKNIFLYLGGFILALAVEKWGLHRRLALLTLLAAGTRPAWLIGGFMLATAGISLWISNTATAVMMLPIGISVVQLVEKRMAGGLPKDAANFSAGLLLAIAYAASLGGMGTLIGTPPNVFFRSFLEEKGIVIGFGQWMLFAIPVVAVLLLLCWLLLTKILFPVSLKEIPGGRELIRGELASLGPVSRGESTVLVVFLVTALAWISRDGLTQWKWLTTNLPFVNSLDDSVIAMTAAVLLFLLPVNFARGIFAMDWKATSRLPWGVLLLFGGGLSLSKAMEETKLADWIGANVSQLGVLPTPVLILLIVAGVVFFSELASNLATATALLPILYQVAVGLKLDPLLLCVPAILAASCGFMLPVATPPNAIVFGTGRIGVRRMMKAGFWLDVAGIGLITLATYAIGGLLGIKY
jgi:solute carrier family 13 (sodium-dependent dicarboxylate transporter), member 2/3/5